MSKLFDAYSHWWSRRADRLCSQVPRYNAIEKLRELPGRSAISFLDEEKGLTMEVWEEQSDIRESVSPRTWKNPLGLPWVLHWWLDRNGLQATSRKIKYFCQRGKRGYSDFDLCGFNDHLSVLISSGVRELREIAHGWPGDPLTFEDWLEILCEIEVGFEMAERLMDITTPVEDYPVLQEMFDRGMFLFHKYYFDLFD